MGKNVDIVSELTKKIVDFRDARDWKQFHNPKDLALSLSLEASEVLEHFQWKNGEELEKYCKTHKDDIGEELADVFYWILLMSHDLDIDIVKALKQKMKKNKEKYSVKKFKGNHRKYNEV
jgi:NTP pyrophosphatase (non-canonical NTP hydrolase)